jgi:hypothetical protein
MHKKHYIVCYISNFTALQIKIRYYIMWIFRQILGNFNFLAYSEWASFALPCHSPSCSLLQNYTYKNVVLLSASGVCMVSAFKQRRALSRVKTWATWQLLMAYSRHNSTSLTFGMCHFRYDKYCLTWKHQARSTSLHVAPFSVFPWYLFFLFVLVLYYLNFIYSIFLLL